MATCELQRISESAKSPVFKRENGLPVPLHVHNCPPLGSSFVERTVELTYGGGTVVGTLAIAVSVVNDSHFR
jgi:hypothetical protein